MPKMELYEIGTYESDLGIEVKKLPFKIRAGFTDCFDSDDDFDYDLRSGRQTICSSTRLFVPRHLKVSFGEKPEVPESAPGAGDGRPADPGRAGSIIKFPVKDNSSSTLQALVNKLKACGALCMDYVGEYWKVVPPSLANYTVGTQKMALPNDGQFADKRSGRMIYNSDVLGATTPTSVAYEILPTELSTVIDGCVGTLDESPVCEIVDISPRHGIAKGAVDNALNPKATFSRKTFIASADSAAITDCLRLVGNLAFVQCVGYQGESIKRAELLVP